MSNKLRSAVSMILHHLSLLVVVVFSAFSYSASISSMKQRVAIVGGGYAGLACAENLIKQFEVSIFDLNLPGKGGASAVSAGLMHPFAPKGNFIWKGVEGYRLNIEKMVALQKATNVEFLDTSTQLLRPIITAQELKKWTESFIAEPSLLSIDSKDDYINMMQDRNLPVVIPTQSLVAVAVIKTACIVDSELYLEAWSKEMLSRGLLWNIKKVENLSELSNSFETVVVACGASIPSFWNEGLDSTSIAPLKVQLVRGQNLFFPVDSGLHIDSAYLKGEYVIPVWRGGSKFILAGATHEHITLQQYRDEELALVPDVKVAESLLRDKIDALCPSVMKINADHANAGVRILTQRSNYGRLPFICRHHKYKNVWMIGGFGSRGLIHHRIVANCLADAILTGDDDRIPIELSRR